MTIKYDKCVISSDQDHVTASDVTVTDVTNVNSSIIHIILSVDHEHLQGSLFYSHHCHH